FMLKLVVNYPSRDEERRIIERMGHPDGVPTASQVTDLQTIVEARRQVDRVYLDPKVTDYILDLVFATRPDCRGQLSPRQKEADLHGLDGLIEYGASPRASLALTLVAKARAFLLGRAYVVPQDVKDIAHDVLRHRIAPTYEAEAENLNTDALVTRLLDELRTP
ncbi:MAG: MoxR family ATPase, partial [Lentisphaeria bacterium]